MKAVLRKALDALLAVAALLPLLAILSMLAVLLMLGFISWQENHVSDEWLIHAMETRLEESIPDEEAIPSLSGINASANCGTIISNC